MAVVPAHDEERRIGWVVGGAARHLPVLVVDDGSEDDTAELARAAGATIIEQRPNRGKGAALRTGFAEALRAGVEAAITLDGDGQHDPAEIPTFVAAHARRTVEGLPSELIIGRRNFSRMPVIRRIANSRGTIVLSMALGRYVPDNQSGYRLVGRRLMREMLESSEAGFAFEVEMIAVCQREGWPIGWVPIATRYGGERSHIRPLAHLREFLAVCWRARRVARASRRAGASGLDG